MELVRRALDESYGPGTVSLVSAAFRWLNHHSSMKPEHNGTENASAYVLVRLTSLSNCFTDAIVVGSGNRQHLETNLRACTEGPLDARKY